MKTPKAPDPYQTAAAQQGAEMGASMASSIMNNPNQINPYGTSTYSTAGYETVMDAQGKPIKVPRYTQTVKLSPAQQQLLDLSNATQANLGRTGVEQSAKLQGYLRQGVKPGSQAWAGSGGPTDRSAVEAAIMGRYKDTAARQASAEDAQLAARGMSVGSGQYGTVADTRARALTDARQQAYLASGAEARANADFANKLRQAQTSENFALRNQPINEISALLSGSQVTMPQFNPFQAQGVNTAPIGSYIGQNYQNKLNAANSFNSGLFNLAGAGLGGWLAM